MLWSDESLNVERECEVSCLAACFPVMEETGHLLRGSRVRSLRRTEEVGQAALQGGTRNTKCRDVRSKTIRE